MTVEQRIKAFVSLGEFLSQAEPELTLTLERASQLNRWYTVENTSKQIVAITQNLTQYKLREWIAPFDFSQYPKTVGLILAGNIPLVGFHDVLSVLLAGFRAQVKVSSDDAGLTAYLLHKLIEIEPQFYEQINIVDRLSNFDLIIATGSDNSSRYFDYYFGSKPHIIRRNRNSVAILNGTETREQLQGLGNDIFDYFGLGCRSVSKLFIPKNYPINIFFEAIESFKEVSNHFKYANNYDYNKSIYLINGETHYDNGFLLLKSDERNASPLAVIFYQEYDSQQELAEQLNAQSDKIQCITTQIAIETLIPTFPLGQAQCPSLTDYADDIDTLAFLKEHTY
ncbi:MAG: acyl-CoA reductase [Sphingobacterium sp.]|uniref:acyl-CoA reductase n=1 Tax=Sphingobacterium sp. JB170 TaxID=1434842 RepID=UPI00097F1D54|nr:acyl-CoA reductase [Sphingobacterium sp. JB170]SJN36010.1 hypothetical protein FM107_08660 [Sphingobacterium sp. JB170]